MCASIRTAQELLTICVDSSILVFKICEDERNLEPIQSGDVTNSFEKPKTGVNLNLTILDSDLSPDGKTLALATSTKQLALVELATLKTGGDFDRKLSLKKTPTAVCQFMEVRFSSIDPNSVFVSTRSGCVHQFHFAESNAFSDEKELLGHLSMVLDHSVSPDGKYLLTADRDEKVRVSRFPQTHIIEAFCLGHSAFVNSVCCLDNKLAVTGGGDHTLRLWDFRTGTCLHVFQIESDRPIRRVRVSANNTIIVLLDGATEIRTFSYDPSTTALIPTRSIQCPSEVLDFAINGQSIFALGRDGIYRAELSDEGMEKCTGVGEDLVRGLASCEDRFPLEDLYKVVAFGHEEEYRERKEKRIGEARKRRRKKDSNNDSEECQ